MRIRVIALVMVVAGACATTDTTTTLWMDPNTPPRFGVVESVQQIVHRVEGNPAGGAVAGALIGGFLFGGRYGPSLLGAAGGAAIGAAASQSSQTVEYQVVVRFDDGGYGTFMYAGYAPFGPGQPVVLTPQGLVPR